MRKNLIIISLFLIILSGCINTGFLADPDEDVKTVYAEAQANFKFNEKEFPYTPMGCWRQILCESGGSGFIFEYKPEDGFTYIKTPMSGSGLDTLGVADSYLTDYLVNDLIANREYGNKMDEFFLKLEEMGIKYYINEPVGITDQEAYDAYKIKGTTACILGDTREDMESIITNYLTGKDARTIDWMELITDLECSPDFTVYIRENALVQAGVTLADIEKLAKDYYNENVVDVKIVVPYFPNEDNVYSYADITTESKFMFEKEADEYYPPIYYWDKKS